MFTSIATANRFFSFLLCVGHGFIAISALIAAVVTPTDVLCVSSQWL